MHLVKLLLLTLSLFLLHGCKVLTTTVGQIRTDTTNPFIVSKRTENQTLLEHCASGIAQRQASKAAPIVASIEDYKTYTIGYVEYSDQGWEYNDGAQRLALIKRMREYLNKPESDNQTVVNLVFVHGWHHSAHDEDCNVNEVRAMVQQLNDDFKPASGPASIRFNGVYIAWRGESGKFPVQKTLSIFDRRNAAEHVAKGAVRQMFADLRHLELDDEERLSTPSETVRRVRTIVIGHSFGGLIAFHSLSPAFINDLSLARPLDGRKPENDPAEGYLCSKAAMARRFWPDMTVLINPAFESSRFQAVHDIAAVARLCKDESPRPKMLIVTAENDGPMKRFFPLFRRAASVVEQYDTTTPKATDLEREANIHGIGFVDRFKTHALLYQKNGCVKLQDLLVDKASNSTSEAPNKTKQAAKHVWVVSAPAEIVDGHSGFLYPGAGSDNFTPYLLHWIASLYLDALPEIGTKTIDPAIQNVAKKYHSTLCSDS